MMSKYTPFKDSNMTENKNNIIDFSTPILMGILNLSDDSFFDGGRYNNKEKILTQCQRMLYEGANIIDLGASSSRPGSKPISKQKELKLLIPIINLLKETYSNIIISVDTFRSSVAKECLKNGVNMINDISAGELDKNMFDIIAKYQPYYIITHMQGNPRNMQDSPNYKDVIQDIYNYLKEKIEKLRILGVNNIIIDPGFGFGKTLKHNYTILSNLKKFQMLNVPILVGISRKSMIYMLLNSSPQEALNGTTIAHSIALHNGANILRVHDVKEAKECVKIIDFMKKKI